MSAGATICARRTAAAVAQRKSRCLAKDAAALPTIRSERAATSAKHRGSADGHAEGCRYKAAAAAFRFIPHSEGRTVVSRGVDFPARRDHHVVDRPGGFRVGSYLSQFLECVHSLLYLSKNNVLAVEIGDGLEGEKELRGVGILPAVGH